MKSTWSIRGLFAESSLLVKCLVSALWVVVGYSLSVIALVLLQKQCMDWILMQKIAQLIMSFCMFAFPAIVGIYLFDKKEIHVLKKVHFPAFVTVFFLVIISIPMVNCLTSLNEAITFPDAWKNIELLLRNIEQQVSETIEQFLASTSVSSLLFNLFLMAAVPAFCEELFFRGLVQKVMLRKYSPSVAICVAAFVFSAFHFQLFGFIPRFLMGIVLGYLFYWSGSLWLSMFAHFVNNAVVVMAVFFTKRGMLPFDIDNIGNDNIELLLMSMLLFGGLWWILYEQLKENKNNKTLSVSLVIATYNWSEALYLTMQSALHQSVLPNEILIADDGSTKETQALVEHLKTNSPVPIVHVWQEDKGFRLAAIRNKAMAQAKYEYIVQVDGDVVLHPDFIKDHKEQAERGCFMRGSRVKLTKSVSQKKLVAEDYKIRYWDLLGNFGLNVFRLKFLRYFFAHRYGKGRVDHLRGCNMAFWRTDLLKVNGYNETFEGWGHEDGELAYRLFNSGVIPKSLKFGGIVYHLWHKEAERPNEDAQAAEREKVRCEGIVWCENGIDKHL